MLGSKTVMVVGTGTIGEPLVGLLCHFKDQLGIEDVLFLEQEPRLSERSKVADLIRRGAHLVADDERRAAFRELGVEVELSPGEGLQAARVVIDCTPAGNAMKEEIYHRYEDSTDLFVAQAGAFGFGKPYARGINDRALVVGEDRYLQVVSCNTQNLAVLLQTFALDGEGADNLVEGDFVCIRRANDISQDGRFVPSPAIEMPRDERFGSHHARDAWHLFQTLGHDLALFSSAMRVNTQLMHVVRFHLRVREPVTRDALLERALANERLAVTYKQTANKIFSFGRDHGFCGRILNTAVLPVDSLHVAEEGTRISGFCFTPQDGNSLLSSVAAAVWGLYPETYEKIIQCLKSYFFAEV